MYLTDFKFLFKESFELRNMCVVGELCYVYTCKIEFVAEQDGLLFAHFGFANQGTHEDVPLGHISGLLLARYVCVVALLAGIVRVGRLVRWEYRNTYTVGVVLIAIYLNCCGWNSERALSIRHKRIGIGEGERRCAFAIHE